MHTLSLFGEAPSTKSAIGGVIKELAEDCVLTYEQVLQADPHDGYSGPLLEAPEGAYSLFQGNAWVMLIITGSKILVEGRVVRIRSAAGSKALDVSHLNAFRLLLARSEKRIHVYEEQGTGLRQYMFLWAEDAPPKEHPVAASCLYIGTADLETGRISL